MGSLENLKVTNTASLVQLSQALAEQINMLRNKMQRFDQTKNAGNSNSQNRSSNTGRIRLSNIISTDGSIKYISRCGRTNGLLVQDYLAFILLIGFLFAL